MRLKYAKLPEYYTLNKSTKQWQRRKRGAQVDGEDSSYDIRRVHAIGRKYTISPRAENATGLRPTSSRLKLVPPSWSYDQLSHPRQRMEPDVFGLDYISI